MMVGWTLRKKTDVYNYKHLQVGLIVKVQMGLGRG